MNRLHWLAFALAGVAAAPAWSAAYVLSPDGSAVVRLVPQGTSSAGSLGSGLFPAGYSIAGTGTGASATITSYDAGFSGSTGGAEIKALFDRGSAPPSGSVLEWVQVITTNLPLGGASSPYLDNAVHPTKPFYSYTTENTQAGLPAGQLNFYDFSTRDPASLASTNPITWNAELYPVVADATGALTVYDGVTWGWTMKKAPVGTVTGSFTNAQPGSAVVSGVGTSTFRWGSGDPSWLSFAASAFDTAPDTPFKLGTLTFHNGTIASGSGASSVDFNTALHFLNVPELDASSIFSTTFSLINTPNVGTAEENADTVSLGQFGFTFNVLEGATATVDVMAKLSTGLSPSRAGTSNGAALAGQFPMEPTPGFTLSIVGLVNPSAGGFVTGTVSSPTSLALLVLVMPLLWGRARARRAA